MAKVFMNACATARRQPALQIADVGYCRYFLRTRQLNSPFTSIRPFCPRAPSVASSSSETERKLCFKQLPEWTEEELDAAHGAT